MAMLTVANLTDPFPGTASNIFPLPATPAFVRYTNFSDPFPNSGGILTVWAGGFAIATIKNAVKTPLKGFAQSAVQPLPPLAGAYPFIPIKPLPSSGVVGALGYAT